MVLSRNGRMEVSQMEVESGGHLGQRALNKQGENCIGCADSGL